MPSHIIVQSHSIKDVKIVFEILSTFKTGQEGICFVTTVERVMTESNHMILISYFLVLFLREILLDRLQGINIDFFPITFFVHYFLGVVGDEHDISQNQRVVEVEVFLPKWRQKGLREKLKCIFMVHIVMVARSYHKGNPRSDALDVSEHGEILCPPEIVGQVSHEQGQADSRVALQVVDHAGEGGYIPLLFAFVSYFPPVTHDQNLLGRKMKAMRLPEGPESALKELSPVQLHLPNFLIPSLREAKHRVAGIDFIVDFAPEICGDITPINGYNSFIQCFIIFRIFHMLNIYLPMRARIHIIIHESINIFLEPFIRIESQNVVIQFS